MAVLNATHASLADMLLAGKPILLVPLTLEQYALAERVEKLVAYFRLTPGTADLLIRCGRRLSHRDTAKRRGSSPRATREWIGKNSGIRFSSL